MFSTKTDLLVSRNIGQQIKTRLEVQVFKMVHCPFFTSIAT